MGVPITIDTTLGFLFHSLAACCILYGAGCMQAWFYFRRYHKRDHWGTQALVAAVLVCDTLQIAFLYAAVYTYTVTNQGNSAFLAHLVPTLIIELIFSGLIAFLVQHFYCYRVYILSKSWLLAAFLSLCSMGSYATLLYFVIICLTQYTTLAELVLQDDISIATNVLGLVADLSISFFLIVLLHRSKTGFRRSTDMLNRLIIFSFNTGLPTSICSILTVILLEAAPGTFIYIFIYVTMGRFYTNCLLVTLNSRDYIRHGSTPATSDNYAMSIPTSALGSHRLEFAGASSTQDHISVRIDKTTENYVDQKAYDAGERV